jgi:hypothetical protein
MLKMRVGRLIRGIRSRQSVWQRLGILAYFKSALTSAAIEAAHGVIQLAKRIVAVLTLFSLFLDCCLSESWLPQIRASSY